MSNQEKEVVFIPVDAIIPYEKNPRINDSAVYRLTKLIEKYGFRDPIHVDEKNLILAGHTRLKCAKNLDMKKVPCLYILGLSEDEKKAYRIAHNKSDEYSVWDYEKLVEEFADLEIKNFDLDLTGFDAKERKDLEVPEMDFDDEEKQHLSGTPQHLVCPKCGFKWTEQD